MVPRVSDPGRELPARVLDKPGYWRPGRVQKTDPAKWIDFWVICDETTAYLFFTRDHKGVWIMTTPLDRFPEGLTEPREVFGPAHEAVHVYKVADRGEYHMIYEMRETGDIRRFGLARANKLSGPWANVTDRFAAGDQLRFGLGSTRWTGEVSHGEFLRAGVDERLEYVPDRARLLIQGMPRAEHNGPYSLLPWRLGVITRE
jgi:endo-1,4-beta-xylanase